MTIKPICENSLRWILAARTRAAVHKYDYRPISLNKFPEVLGDGVTDYGHSYTSMIWTLTQAKRIEDMGLRYWLETEDALGYKHVFNRDLKKFMEEKRRGGA